MKILPCDEIGRPTASVRQPLRFLEVCLLSSQFLCQQLLLRDVHCSAVESLKNSVFYHRNTNTTDVPYLPIWPNNSVCDIAAAALLMHRLNCFGHGGSVLRMDRSQILLKARSPVFRIKPVNLVDLVRPIDI